VNRSTRPHLIVAKRGVSTIEHAFVIASVALFGLVAWGALGDAVERQADCAVRAIADGSGPCGWDSAGDDRARGSLEDGPGGADDPAASAAAGLTAVAGDPNGASGGGSGSGEPIAITDDAARATFASEMEEDDSAIALAGDEGALAADGGDDGAGSGSGLDPWGWFHDHVLDPVAGVTSLLGDEIADTARWVWNTPPVDFVRGFVVRGASELWAVLTDMWNFGLDLAGGVLHVIRDPGIVVDWLSHPERIASAAVLAGQHVVAGLGRLLSESWDTIRYGTARERGELLGYWAAQIGTLFLPWTKLNAPMKAAELAMGMRVASGIAKPVRYIADLDKISSVDATRRDIYLRQRYLWFSHASDRLESGQR